MSARAYICSADHREILDYMFGSKKNAIYLDYAASTPVSKSVMAAMEPYFSDLFANPSSLHIPGQKAQAGLDTARHDVADMLGCGWQEVLFTSSATESLNLALRGVIKASRESVQKPHIITTNIEHSAVLKTCQDLESDGVEVTYLPVNSEGLIKAKQVEVALQENTVLVSVMYVNNEIGTIQPIAEIAKTISRARSKSQIANRKSSSHKPFAISHLPFFHTDAVQATNYLDINVEHLGVDLMTFSGHKIYGPKGIGMLYKKETVKMRPQITGGSQERELRAGTENVAAIVGFAQALKDVEEEKSKETQRVHDLRELFIEKILKGVPSATLNGSRDLRVAGNANFCFSHTTSEVLIPTLDALGVYASGGSACSARVPEPSHVIAALGGEAECAKSSIRFSLGRPTTRDQIESAAAAVIQLVSI